MNSLKKELITCFGVSTTMDSLKNNRLVLLTSVGVIIGTFVSHDDETNSEPVKFLDQISVDIACNYKQQNNIDSKTPLDGNDGFLSLKDVQIKSGNNTLNFNFINIFFDQIIGVTIAGSVTD